jgi:hypothetical protein
MLTKIVGDGEQNLPELTANRTALHGELIARVLAIATLGQSSDVVGVFDGQHARGHPHEVGDTSTHGLWQV